MRVDKLYFLCFEPIVCYEHHVSKEENSPVYLAATRYQIVELYRLHIAALLTASLLY